MAPKRTKVLAKKSTNPKRAKVVHDVPQKQPPTTPTTISTPVKETGVSTKASEAPPSVQPPSVQPVVPPPKPVSSLNFFFFKIYRVKNSIFTHKVWIFSCRSIALVLIMLLGQLFNWFCVYAWGFGDWSEFVCVYENSVLLAHFSEFLATIGE